MSAQQKDLAGEYYLRGVMETGSGFKLEADSTFQFFFSYGALDREGKGKWTVKDDHVIFNSAPRPGNDFALVSSKQTKDDSITIKIIDQSGYFLSHVYCLLRSGEKQAEAISNKEGIVSFPKQHIDSLTLIFEFCPERTSVFSIKEPTHNYFEFRFEPWMMEVFFIDYSLHIKGYDLEGAHPLLNGKSYDFIKSR